MMTLIVTLIFAALIAPMALDMIEDNQRGKLSTMPRLSTFQAPGLGWFTLPRYVSNDYNADQVIAAGQLALQSGE